MTETEVRTKLEEIKAKIRTAKLAQRNHGFGMPKRNAALFGKYEREIENLYTEYDKVYHQYFI